MTQTVFAAATVSQQATGTIWLGYGTAGLPALPAGYDTHGTLSTPVVITESGTGTLAGTFTMLAPAGWNWDVANTPSVSGTNGLAGNSTVAPTVTTITITITNQSTNNPGVLTISNLRLRPAVPGTGASGDITAGGANGEVPAGTVLGHVDPASTHIRISATPDATVSSDGTDSAQLRFQVRGANAVPLNAVLVNVTTSRGTLSATSNTTVSTACATTGNEPPTVASLTDGSCTLTFRGNGTTGTAQITATTASPNEAVNTFNATVGSSNTTPTAVKHFSTNNSGHVLPRRRTCTPARRLALGSASRSPVDLVTASTAS
jgi:hypothetical protein